MVQATTAQLELVLHAAWVDGNLWLWGEDVASGGGLASAPAIAAAVEKLGAGAVEQRSIELRLPTADGAIQPSPEAARALGHEVADVSEATLGSVTAEAVTPIGDPADAIEKLIEADAARLAHADAVEGGGVVIHSGASLEFFAVVHRAARHLLAQQRFVPMIRQEAGGQLRGSWYPWLGDENTGMLARTLRHAMPPIARAGVDGFDHQAWAIVEDCLASAVDRACRRVMLAEAMATTVDGRDPMTDAQVAWLQGLLADGERVPMPSPERPDVVKRVRNWIGGLDERGASAEWRLCLRLNEPLDMVVEDMKKPPEALRWSLSFHLQAIDAEAAIVDAADVWLLPTDGATLHGRRLEKPQELLLAEIGRAARLYPPLEAALRESEPIELLLPTADAYEFLREVRPLLLEQGFGMLAPSWWESQGGRLGARLKLDPETGEMIPDSGPGVTNAAGPQLGLTTLVDYHWEIALGDTTLSLHEFEKLANEGSPLVKVGGRWVEVRPEDVQAAVKFIGENPGGQMEVGEALRLAYATDVSQTGVPVLGMETSGWVSAMLGGEMGQADLPMLEPPVGFKGSLRPYQLRGLSWMAFLERFRFGLCLADDMGLGKTIQMLALLSAEREAAAAAGESVKPTLIVAPMSVLGNWQHETERFCPDMKAAIHHGTERLTGDEFVEMALKNDVVVTTYALAHRDEELLGKVEWGRVVLDEAQCIKNPQAKQAQAVRQIPAEKRVALTGTPVENRLAELWSIMDFLNPGYLGAAATFRRRFSVPIERYHDRQRSEQLRGLVRPFVLRRLKTDSDVVSDLPEKIEAKEFCHLTSEQAKLYEETVRKMLTAVESSEGMHRRGLVLSALVKLKQICNHPAQMLKEWDQNTPPPEISRSGKCIRIMEMLEEVFAEGDQALVFTQFRQMGHILAAMIRHNLDREVLFLHGGTPQTQRVKMIDEFQNGGTKKPVLIASLKAGGVGLNLTAANHVFHFDRWWNPAVENQATDRAFRIGQTRTVFVHKFVVSGTLEERIDEMIEQKTELAERIVGSGEQWLTELTTDQLQDLLSLRTEAVGDDE